MSKKICELHDQSLWNCFQDASGSWNHFDYRESLDSIKNSKKEITFSTMSDVEKLVQEIHDSIHIGIVPVEDSDYVMFGTVKKLAEKYEQEKVVGINVDLFMQKINEHISNPIDENNKRFDYVFLSIIEELAKQHLNYKP